MFEYAMGFGQYRMLKLRDAINEHPRAGNASERDAPSSNRPATTGNEVVYLTNEDGAPFHAPGFAKGLHDHREARKMHLVGMLKHDPPIVYAFNARPDAWPDKAAAPIERELSPFEKHGLERLRQGKELVLAMRGKSLLMFGAIRASKECTRCHEQPPGALLGAFSYEIDEQSAKIFKR
jgi:hypothetical protein